MQNKEIYQAVFSLMQDESDLMENIDIIKKNCLIYENINIDNLNSLDERFYNFLLIFLRNTPDSLWSSAEHRVKVYEIIKTQLDEYHVAPTPYVKDKHYI